MATGLWNERAHEYHAARIETFSTWQSAVWRQIDDGNAAVQWTENIGEGSPSVISLEVNGLSAVGQRDTFSLVIDVPHGYILFHPQPDTIAAETIAQLNDHLDPENMAAGLESTLYQEEFAREIIHWMLARYKQAKPTHADPVQRLTEGVAPGWPKLADRISRTPVLQRLINADPEVDVLPDEQLIVAVSANQALAVFETFPPNGPDREPMYRLVISRNDRPFTVHMNNGRLELVSSEPLEESGRILQTDIRIHYGSGFPGGIHEVSGTRHTPGQYSVYGDGKSSIRYALITRKAADAISLHESTASTA